MMNAELRTMVADLKRQLNNTHHVHLEYSDALTKVDFSRLELINSVDGWHPSMEGHKVWLTLRSTRYVQSGVS